MGHPRFVQHSPVADWVTPGTSKTASVTVQPGDMLLAVVIGPASLGALSPLNDGVGGMWTFEVNWPTTLVWSTKVSTAGTIVVTLRELNGVLPWGGFVQVWRNADAGAHREISGQSDVNPITTTKAHSALLVTLVDLNAADDPQAWLVDAGQATPLVDEGDGINYRAHAAYHPDAGAIREYAVGLNAPGEAFSNAVLEITTSDDLSRQKVKAVAAQLR